MKTCVWLWFMGTLMGCGGFVAAAEEIVYLDATFDDKTIDQAIGTGGAALGEPIKVDAGVTAVVRATPFGSPSLEVQDAADAAGRVTFEFLEDAEVTTGLVVVAMDLWFTGDADVNQQAVVYLREHGFSGWQFLNMFFWGTGEINVGTETDWANGLGPYPFGQAFTLLIVVNMDTGLISGWLDGELLFSDLEHGVVGRGIGRVEIGMVSDTDRVPTIWVDRLRVSNTPPDTPAVPTTWGAVKSLFRVATR